MKEMKKNNTPDGLLFDVFGGVRDHIECLGDGLQVGNAGEL